MKKLRFFMLMVFCMGIISANGQIDIENKVKNETNSRASKNVDQGIDKTLDSVENGIKGLFKKKEPSTQKKDSTRQTQNQENNQNVKPQENISPSLQAYSKYDFVPGEKVIFYEDFSQDAVGDFPALWNTNGSAEVVTTNLFPGNWMKFDGRGAVWTDELLDLPENYTIEFDIIPTSGTESNGGMAGYDFRLMQAKNVKAYDHGTAPGNGGFLFTMEYFGRPGYSTWSGPGMEECAQAKISGVKEGDDVKQKINNLYHIAIWVQKTRIRLYQKETKVFDLPRAFPAGCVKPDRIRLEEGAAMISNVRIAVGAPDTRNKLLTEGKLVSYGIYFDVNKDVVKPESYGTLKEIATILNEVPDVKVKIVGHTDSDGQDAANLDLSKRRAASVKAELVKSFGVNGERLETDGMGENQNLAPNDTPSNKALNRRVEFVKL
ncbi:MAG TPA: OmpA family protein [Draconibacterium sp.]|nr:OmpA family protein [Draconibacterium sp.]HRX11895.1 OmpA family protein [Draconibacterium sp.]